MCTEIQSEEKDYLGKATVTENVFDLKKKTKNIYLVIGLVYVSLTLSPI